MGLYNFLRAFGWALKRRNLSPREPITGIIIIIIIINAKLRI